MSINRKTYKKEIGFRSLVFCMIFVLLLTSTGWAEINVIASDAGEVADYYAMTYDGNGVEGTWTDNGVASNEKYTIKGSDETGIENEHLILMEWNTEEDGSGASYSPGDEIYIDDFIILYAQWRIKGELDVVFETAAELFDIPQLDEEGDTVVVTYRWSNIDFSEDVPTDVEYTIKTPKIVGISAESPFISWFTIIDGKVEPYSPGETLWLTKNLVLFADINEDTDTFSVLYERNRDNVNYYEHSGYKGEDYKVLAISETDISPPSQFVLQEWNLMRDGNGESLQSGDIVKGLANSISLYARWRYVDPSKQVLIFYISNGSRAREDAERGDEYEIKAPEALELNIPANSNFAGWKLSDEENVIYQAGEPIVLDRTPYVFEAIWEMDDNSCRITYDGNGGVRAATGEASYSVSAKKGTKDYVQYNDFHHADETLMFIGWNSQINGEGHWYDQGQEVTVQDDITFYAQWGDKNEYTDVIYHGNEGAVSGSGATTYIQTVKRGSVYHAMKNMFVYSGNNFQSWNTTANGSGTSYLPNAQVKTDTATVNLYAQWKSTGGNGGGNGGGGGGGGNNRNTYDVIYHANNGTDEADIKESHTPNTTVTTKAGSIFTAPDDQVFRGWATTASGEVAYLAADTFTMPSRDVNLYAVWEQLLSYDDHFAYIVGYDDGTVGPGRNVTREEVATIFYRLLTDEARSNYRQTTNSFSDVTEDRWSNIAISTLANARIVNGYEDGTFKPGNAVTRAELAVIAAIFDNSPDTEEDLFSDIAGHWAGPYINRAALRGWVSGYNDGTFQPGNNITRAELVTLVNKVLRREPKDSSSLLPDMAAFVDNMDTTQWYYLAIQEAANSHDYDADGSKEIWTELRTNRDWLQLERP